MSHQHDSDARTVEQMLEHAKPNVLRMAVYQATGDAALESMELIRVPMRGGAFFGYQLHESDAELVRAKAVEYLTGGGATSDLPAPSDEQQRDMMGMLTGQAVSDRAFRLGREELALDEFPREARWTDGQRPAVPEDFLAVVVGAGASGIAAAVQLERLGIPYVLLERQSGIGGTWHLNHYPDARVDTSSFLYQFKFVKNYPWPEYFAPQREVKKYLEHVAREYGVDQHIVFDVELERAEFDEATGRWALQLDHADGRREVRVANVILSGAGQFSTPRRPDIEGADEYAGRFLHTTAWPDDFDVTGQRVAIIGNGSTGVQLMPRLAQTAGHVYAFQRTPQWISPMEQYRDEISAEVRWLFDHVPFYWNWYCYYSQVTTDAMQDAQEYDTEWQDAGGRISKSNDGLRDNLTAYIHGKVGHLPELEKQLVPDYAPLARRLIVDNGWYDALLQDNVDLVTAGIRRFTPSGIETVDGETIEVDAVVMAAGFDVSKYLWPTEYIGRDGTSMQSVWDKDGPRAYLGLTVPKFPNLFIFYGPNSQTRSGAFLSWIEVWSRYAAQGIVHLIENELRTMEVRDTVFEDYNRRLDDAHDGLIWETEGPVNRNYYVNKHGRQNVNWPWRNEHYHEMVAALNPDDFVTT